jgi:hypothetical protein
MIILLKKSQLALFDAPVHVAGHVRKDGVYVDPHVRIQKIAAKPAASSPRHSKLDEFIARRGGTKELGRTLASLTAGQQQRLFAEMARLDGLTPEQVADRFGELASAPEPVGDLFAKKPAAAPPPAVSESDQDRSNREWVENYDRVAGAEDLNAISVKDIERAINFASHQVSRLGPGKAWEGDEAAKKKIQAFNREIGNLEFHLKHRGEAAAPAVAEPEKPKAKRARKAKAKQEQQRAPEPTRPSDMPSPPPGERWSADRGAMPGEPFAFLDGDSETAVAAMRETEVPGKGVIYEVHDTNGDLIASGSTEAEAARLAEQRIDGEAARRQFPRSRTTRPPRSASPPASARLIAATSTPRSLLASRPAARTPPPTWSCCASTAATAAAATA